MAVKVVLTNASRVTKRLPEQESDLNEDIRINRNTYQQLGSLAQNKTLVTLYNEGKLAAEYIRLLDELNDLYIVKNYPELASEITLADYIEELDEYLGSLGVSIEYEYEKDKVNISPWLAVDRRTPTRVLTDETDNTYLTTSSGTEVLVRY